MLESKPMAHNDVGEAIPFMTPHAISVSLPTWNANLGYEEGEEWVTKRMKSGYPRFLIHDSIARLANSIVDKYGLRGEAVMLFPSETVAQQCSQFLLKQERESNVWAVRVVILAPFKVKSTYSDEQICSSSTLAAVFYPRKLSKPAKSYWQHTGEGISSRRAENFWIKSNGGLTSAPHKGEACNKRTPRRYHGCRKRSHSERKPFTGWSSANPHTDEEHDDCRFFIEERFGRNLDTSLAAKAKVALCRRISGCLVTEIPSHVNRLPQDTGTNSICARKVLEKDVYLYPTGMSAIYNTHRMLLETSGAKKSIIYGFPYVDTLKILENFGPGCLFYGQGSSDELQDLENRLSSGEEYLALFCEFPGNPLLKCPDLARIRNLADRFEFAVVVDETIGNFLNVDVIPYADIVVSSLTKIFSGDSNVMGGSAILNSNGRNYDALKRIWSINYEDNVWSEDAIFLERNSRDFGSRVSRINRNAELIYETLIKSPFVKEVYYPKYSSTKDFYNLCRLPQGGYGGLLSVTFHKETHAILFYDTLEIAKGPSLGTNFTLSCPYVILAHYNELDWVKQYGVDPYLIRISVGLEDSNYLSEVFRKALFRLETDKSLG